MNAPKAPGLASRARAGWSGGERAEGARQTTPEGRQALRGVPARPVTPGRHPHRAKKGRIHEHWTAWQPEHAEQGGDGAHAAEARIASMSQSTGTSLRNMANQPGGLVSRRSTSRASGRRLMPEIAPSTAATPCSARASSTYL
ncbi:hypothetical protein GCM10010286_01110 [Streptomyces toxytricini]|nr:hypothetical protein GCM10010286_01110 [Streptomyces toxytricini]